MSTGFTQFDKQAGEETWFTPKNILEPLGEFDLDPCTQSKRPFNIAVTHFEYDKGDDGLQRSWQLGSPLKTRCFVNPPYGTEKWKWMKKLALHGNGIALIFARTETKSFFPWVWDHASGICFLRKCISFIRKDGTVGGNAGAPSVLISYDPLLLEQKNALALENCGLGKFVSLRG